jgi:hypothetical protein
MATSRLLSAVPTSTGVDTEALPTTDLEQAAWDASVMLVSTGTDTDGNAMAVVSVPGHEADGPTSTGEGGPELGQEIAMEGHLLSKRTAVAG